MPVENVLIYVIDSLRWDTLPTSVRERGVAVKTAAQSLFSAPSFATLATGRYPPHHGVYNWTDRMPPHTPTLFDLDGIQSGFWQRGPTGGQAIFPILQQEGKTELEELDPPFVYLERNTFAHVPFAGTGVSTAEEYYSRRERNWERMRAEYREGVRRSVEEFETRLDELEERGLLEETLVVVTSDHGELFGEHGATAHGSPACPELVYVPTVFIHPSLSAEDFQGDTTSEIIEHVDVVQTLLSALGEGDSFETDGVDLLTDERPRDWAYNHIDIIRSGQSVYAAESLWWHDSGHVFTQNSGLFRAVYALHQLLRSPSRKSSRDAPIDLLQSYLSSETTYGVPPCSAGQARKELESFREQLSDVESQSVTLDADTDQLLKDLGYR